MGCRGTPPWVWGYPHTPPLLFGPRVQEMAILAISWFRGHSYAWRASFTPLLLEKWLKAASSEAAFGPLLMPKDEGWPPGHPSRWFLGFLWFFWWFLGGGSPREVRIRGGMGWGRGCQKGWFLPLLPFSKHGVSPRTFRVFPVLYIGKWPINGQNGHLSVYPAIYGRVHGV